MYPLGRAQIWNSHDMSMNAELQATLDAALATLLADLTAAQTAYHDALVGEGEEQAPRGKYAQVLPAGTWAALGMAAPNIGCTVWVDEYVGDDGLGWLLNAEAVDGGVTYRRVMQRGNETWREQAWAEVPA